MESSRLFCITGIYSIKCRLLYVSLRMRVYHHIIQICFSMVIEDVVYSGDVTTQNDAHHVLILEKMVMACPKQTAQILVQRGLLLMVKVVLWLGGVIIWRVFWWWWKCHGLLWIKYKRSILSNGNLPQSE